MGANTYIRSVKALEEKRLYVELHTGSSMIVDFKNMLDTIKYCRLKDQALFENVHTDGLRVVWGDNEASLTVRELMDAALDG